MRKQWPRQSFLFVVHNDGYEGMSPYNCALVLFSRQEMLELYSHKSVAGTTDSADLETHLLMAHVSAPNKYVLFTQSLKKGQFGGL